MSKNIKSTAVNNLEYTGIVKLSQYTNGKKFMVAEKHNEGGKALFNFLTDCLVGDFDIAKIDRPSKIMLLNKDGAGNLAKATNTSFIYLLSKPEKVYSTEKKGIVRYSFIIPQDYFVGTDFNAIGLYTGSTSELDLNDYAAFCELNLSGVSLSISSVLVLDWELHISN
jgi:hypothetical protein